MKPQIVRNYQGGDIVLPADRDAGYPRRRQSGAARPDRQRHHHHRRHDPARRRQQGRRRRDHGCGGDPDEQPADPHGTLKILFTPDEEVGHGVDHVDLKKLGAAFGYTMDGESAGNLEDETFSADKATITVRGVSAHPGFAKGKIENAIKIASRIVERLPQGTCSPETTEEREGFLHPTDLQATLEGARLSLIVRDFAEGIAREGGAARTDRQGRDAGVSAAPPTS